MEYRNEVRICRESRQHRLAKERPGSSLNQPKRNDAVVASKDRRAASCRVLPSLNQTVPGGS